MTTAYLDAPFTTAADLIEEVQSPAGDIESRNPATGEVIGLVSNITSQDLDLVISTARKTQVDWANRPDSERRAFLNRAADAIDASAEALAELLSREQGKPMNGPNARFEVTSSAQWLRATAETTLDPEVLVDEDGRKSVLTYRPLGVVGAVGPWNWPMMISVWQIAPSLLMGNTVVIKPSEYTPLSVLALVKVLNQALPAGVLSVVVGDGDTGRQLTSHPGIDKIMFTGSTPTGKAIIRSSADTVKRLTLELGGNDPGIVLPDADPKAIVEDLFWGAFLNTGQTCTALKRLYVHESIYEKVCQELTEFSRQIPMGEGLDESNLLGPLQNKMQFDIVTRLVQSAKDAGARILTGGDPEPGQPGYFYPVTLVADIANDNPLVAEEQFGPALPIVSYASIDEAVEMANALDVGLGASVWSSDREHAWEVAARIKSGTVWINRHAVADPRVPFGGAKQSGYGLEFGVEGLKQVSQPQVISG